jgi:(p)ppGpp synthase/HD superfamily hydrolase
VLTNRFAEALQYAAVLHNHQVRKGSNIPYVSHLLSVAALVLEHGGDEDQAIAALLHDAVEDQGGQETLEEIRRRFGERVADLVAGCTDSFDTPKPPWRQRKETYLAHLLVASPEVRLVSLADKVHNARSLLATLRREGDAAWGYFKGGKTGTLWYYQSLLAAFQNAPHPNTSELVAELAGTLREIQDQIAH